MINFETMQQDQFSNVSGRFHSEGDRDHNMSLEFNAQFGPAPVAAGCTAGHGGTLDGHLIGVVYIPRHSTYGNPHFRLDRRIID